MATPDWEAIESAYWAGVLSLCDIGEQYGVTEGAIRKRAKKFGWVRKSGTQVRRSGTQKNKVRTTEKAASPSGTQKSTQPKSGHPPDTKPIRGVRTDPPTNPFATVWCRCGRLKGATDDVPAYQWTKPVKLRQ